MLKYLNWDIVMAEVPDEITLAINISGCPNRCIGCHSPELQSDEGHELNHLSLFDLVELNKGITCVAFMGGDHYPQGISRLAFFIKDYYNLKIAWYSGRIIDDENCPTVPVDIRWFDYIKLGPYIEKYGPLNKRTTNQRMYRNTGLSSSINRLIGWEDITYKFWKDA